MLEAIPALAAWLSNRLPARCAVCGAWPSAPVCGACTAHFAPARARCITCAAPLKAAVAQCGRCLIEPPPVDASFAAVDYDWPWSEPVLRFKYGGETAWARTFAELMRASPGVQPWLEGVDALVPLPLARARLLERGYNQALLLARALAPRRVEHAWLQRVRETPPQEGLSRTQRQHNVRGAYAVDPRLAPRVQGRSVLLIDDVMTSGASVFEAARALRSAGAARVAALVFARTDSD